MVEWEIESGSVVDAKFLRAHLAELEETTHLRVGPAYFDTRSDFEAVLVPTLERISFSFLEVGPNAGGTYPKPCAETNEALFALRQLPRLTKLDLSWSYCIDDTGVGSLARLKQLQSLHLESNITDAGLAELGALPNLKTVDFTCSRTLTGSGFDAWPSMPLLRAIVLSQCEKVTDEALRIVTKAPELDFLVLSGCKKLTLGALSRLKGGPRLATIMLYGVALDLDTIRRLRANNPCTELECDLSHLSASELIEAEGLVRAPV